MTTIIIITLAVLSALVTCALLAAVGLAYWVAMGEPDVNGDPERDAGLESTADGRWVTRDSSTPTRGKEGLSSAFFPTRPAVWSDPIGTRPDVGVFPN